MGLTVEQVAQALSLSVDEVQRFTPVSGTPDLI